MKDETVMIQSRVYQFCPEGKITGINRIQQLILHLNQLQTKCFDFKVDVIVNVTPIATKSHCVELILQEVEPCSTDSSRGTNSLVLGRL